VRHRFSCGLIILLVKNRLHSRDGLHVGWHGMSDRCARTILACYVYMDMVFASHFLLSYVPLRFIRIPTSPTPMHRLRFMPGLRSNFCTWLISGGPVDNQSQTHSKQNRLEALSIVVRFSRIADRSVTVTFARMNNEGIAYTKYSQEHNM